MIWPGLTSGTCWDQQRCRKSKSATIKRFNERFARFNLKDTAIRPSYGLAEATLCVAAPRVGRPAETVRFDYEHLSSGRAKPCSNGAESAVSTSSAMANPECAWCEL